MIATIDLELEKKPESSKATQKVPATAVARHIPIQSVIAAPRQVQTSQESTSNGDLKGPVKRILKALAEFEAIGRTQGITRSSVASWCGVKASTGSFKNYLSTLRVNGLIMDVDNERISLTDAGRAASPAVDSPANTRDLLARAQSIFGKTPAAMLKLIHDAYPGEVTREYLAESLGIQADTGSFKNHLSELRSAGLIVDRHDKKVACSEWMFID
jgi:Mn-dependent DtxR family transcriptional regulator